MYFEVRTYLEQIGHVMLEACNHKVKRDTHPVWMRVVSTIGYTDTSHGALFVCVPTSHRGSQVPTIAAGLCMSYDMRMIFHVGAISKHLVIGSHLSPQQDAGCLEKTGSLDLITSIQTFVCTESTRTSLVVALPVARTRNATGRGLARTAYRLTRCGKP